jgi:hypothetical protein
LLVVAQLQLLCASRVREPQRHARVWRRAAGAPHARQQLGERLVVVERKRLLGVVLSSCGQLRQLAARRAAAAHHGENAEAHRCCGAVTRACASMRSCSKTLLAGRCAQK